MRNMYIVFDVKSESVLGGIVLEVKDAPAIRAFHDALNPKNNSVLSQHPADFELLVIGTIFDDGRIVAADAPSTVATGAQWAAANLMEETFK